MTIFWFAVAAMLLLTLVIILWPMMSGSRNKLIKQYLGKKQDNVTIFNERLNELDSERSQGLLDDAGYAVLKTELEKSLLVDARDQHYVPIKHVDVSKKHWLLATGFGLVVIVSSLLLYGQLGRQADFKEYLALKEQGAFDQKAPDFEEAIASLEAKLEQNPKDIANWFLLAKTYSMTQQYNKAAEVFKELFTMMGEKAPHYATIKGSYAQAKFLASNEQMTPEIKQTIEQALAIDPKESNSLTLLGIEAFNQDNFKQAVSFWEKAKTHSAPEQLKQFLEPAIASARGRLGEDVMPESSSQPNAESVTPVTTAKAPKITVKLALSPNFKDQVKPDDKIFVFARPAGGRMPLAAEQLTVANLPTTIILDDSKAVMPTAKLSSASEVDVTARVSFSGQAISQSGDLFVTQQQVNLSSQSQPLDLTINKVVP